jgi:uncharacterized SAM-binding protein YcdF (DUF218 family)
MMRPSTTLFLAWFVVVAAITTGALAVRGTERGLATALLALAFVAYIVILNGRAEDGMRSPSEARHEREHALHDDFSGRPWGRA